MIVAESRLLAMQAAGSVIVSYNKGEKPIVSAREVMRTLKDRNKLVKKSEQKKNGKQLNVLILFLKNTVFI
jgi:hypothetical protein